MDRQLKQIREIWFLLPDWARDKIIKFARNAAKRERWKDIVVPKGSGKFTEAVRGKYQISNLGRVCHKRTKRQVSIYSSALYNRPLHSIVCRTFHGLKSKPGLVARHLDGDSENNCSGNLKWGTRKANARDKKRHVLLCLMRDAERRSERETR